MEGLRFIPTAVHGVLDYLVGIALILAPNIFAFTDGPAEAVWVPRVLGVALILYSLLTDYELGVFRVLPMSYHLVVDFVAAAFLALSPWIFGFADQDANVWYPHLIVGVVVLLVVVCSKTMPSEEMAAA